MNPLQTLRRRNRQLAIECLFKLENSDDYEESHVNSLIQEVFELENKTAFDTTYAKSLIQGVMNDRSQIDQVISDHLKEGWKLARIPKVDRNILRVAIYELLNIRETDGAVIINEAIELSKEFSTENSPAFINGLLESVYQEIQN